MRALIRRHRGRDVRTMVVTERRLRAQEDRARVRAQRRDPADYVWVTKDRQFLPVKLMDDGHVLNAFRFVLRNARGIVRSDAASALRFEMECGDEDWFHPGIGIDEWEHLDTLAVHGTDEACLVHVRTTPRYVALQAELRRRHLFHALDPRPSRANRPSTPNIWE